MAQTERKRGYTDAPGETYWGTFAICFCGRRDTCSLFLFFLFLLAAFALRNFGMRVRRFLDYCIREKGIRRRYERRQVFRYLLGRSGRILMQCRVLIDCHYVRQFSSSKSERIARCPDVMQEDSLLRLRSSRASDMAIGAGMTSEISSG